ncbi:hypothetical protein HOY80DRAFT_640227 [Tuber brumale]|nr:hypothetical protein HOY80DRAFT_1037762 [Tuber brumale]KAG0642122.1 hypothetical protein HOY80DRAFT_1108991 [Tuber brumale]KAG0642403.1 hypothetical protein HOY80DRAFT_640227 [Tuber brumale]
MPEITEDINIDETHCDDLIAEVSSRSNHIRQGHRTRHQACYLPILNLAGSGSHQIGEAGIEGLLMATGHSCRGSNNAPATLKLLSEIVVEGKAVSLGVGQMDPPRIL